MIKKPKIKISWRLIWYSTLLWVLTFILGGLIVLPWYYLVLPLVILLVTVYYFDRTEQVKLVIARRVRKNNDMIFALGLWLAILWFLAFFALSLFTIARFYYFDVFLYLSDPRNWLYFPLVLLMPVVYSILLQNSINRSKIKRRRAR